MYFLADPFKNGSGLHKKPHNFNPALPKQPASPPPINCPYLTKEFDTSVNMYLYHGCRCGLSPKTSGYGTPNFLAPQHHQVMWRFDL